MTIKWLSAALISCLCSLANGQEAWFDVDELDPPAAQRPNLETPQACLENFIDACREQRFSQAAMSLNLRLAGPVDDGGRALAEKLFFVLNQELWIDWESLPDRPDGMMEPSTLTSGGAMAGEVRRSIRLGAIDIHGREIPVRIERVKAGDSSPIWLFSAQTVENIEALYEAHGPSWIARAAPDWANTRVFGVQIWQVLALVVALVGAPLAGLLVGSLVFRRLNSRLPGPAKALAEATHWPIGALVAALILWFVVEWLLPLPSTIAAVSDTATLIMVVAAAAWLAMRLIDLFVQRVAKEAIQEIHEEESETHRRLLTQITIARYAVMLLVVAIGASVVLIEMNLFRTIGVALLTSAGAAALIIGIAGHAVLGNLIAGLQIALSQPIRIGDTVIVLDEWGSIEDITYTYVVVRTWDRRRLVVPIGYFVSNAIENWSKTDTFLIKPIYLKLDFRADVEAVREKFLELVRQDEDWDSERDEPEALVTDADDSSITVRLTCGGATSSAAWSLHCRVREAMLAWLREHDDGLFLPEQRIRLRGDAGTAGAA